MSFFEGALITPSCWLLDRGTQSHHFLSNLALTVATAQCSQTAAGKLPVIESPRETTPPPFFLSLLLRAASPGLSSSVPYILGHPIEPPNLALIYIAVTLLPSFMQRPQIFPREDSAHVFLREKRRIYSSPVIFPSRLGRKKSVTFLSACCVLGLSMHGLLEAP